MYRYVTVIMLMLASINFASAQVSEVSDGAKLAVSCIYLDEGLCSDITLKYKSGEMISQLNKGNIFITIPRSGNINVYNKSIFSNKNIGNFDITLEEVPYCKFYIKLTAYWIFSRVDRFELVCSKPSN